MTRCFTDQGYGPTLSISRSWLASSSNTFSAAQVHLDGIGHISKVRHHADFHAVSVKREAHGIDRVVRDRKAVDIDIADRDSRAGLEMLDRGLEIAPGNRWRGKVGQIDRTVEFPGKRNEPGDVIRMLVRDDDSVDLLRILADRQEFLESFLAAETGIHQYARAAGSNKCAIPRTRTRQYADLDDDRPLVSL